MEFGWGGEMNEFSSFLGYKCGGCIYRRRKGNEGGKVWLI